MEELFYQCVDIIVLISEYTGLTYEEVNIWIFIIIEPIILLILTLIMFRYRYLLYKETIKSINNQKPIKMKKTILMIVTLFVVLTVSSQVETDTSGNFFIQKSIETPVDSLTNKIFTNAKGVSEPVYVGKRGSYYVARTSKKTGAYYRKYLGIKKEN